MPLVVSSVPYILPTPPPASRTRTAEDPNRSLRKSLASWLMGVASLVCATVRALILSWSRVRWSGTGKAPGRNSVTQGLAGFLGLSASFTTSFGMADKGSASFRFADGKNWRRHSGQRPWVTERFAGRSMSSISWLHHAQTRFIARLPFDGLKGARFIPTPISG